MADHGERVVGHADHDLELVARAAAGDLAASEAMLARDLLAACPTCAALADDLRVITLATRTLPHAADAAAHRPAPRDFRLTPADAARLRPRGLAGIARRLGGLDLGFGARVQGLGGALVSLGLVGLLVSAGVPALLGGAAGSAAEVDMAGAPAKGGPTHQAVVPAASGIYALATAEDTVGSTDNAREATTAPATPWAAITAGSIIVATAGFVLVAIGWRARRARPEGT